jgi:hypothetical protein
VPSRSGSGEGGGGDTGTIMSERTAFDLPWIMARLRHMVEQYQTVPFVGDAGLTALLRVTYRDRQTGDVVTLVVGVEPASNDDTEAA